MKLQNISIFCNGSRGDIQPYVAVGVALKKSGYTIRLLTASMHKPFVESFGLQQVDIFADDKTDFSPSAHTDFISSGKFIPFIEMVCDQFRLDAAADDPVFVREMTNNRPDLLIMHAWHPYLQLYAREVLHIPVLEIRYNDLASFDRNRAPFGLPTLPNGEHQKTVDYIFRQFYDTFPSHDAAMVSLGGSKLLPDVSFDVFLKEVYTPQYPRIVLQSPMFQDILYPQADPVHVRFVGAGIIDQGNRDESANKEAIEAVVAEKDGDNNEAFGGSESKERIEQFLANDPTRKPVYMGWGSITCISSEFMLKRAVSALKRSNQRGIILGGWAGLSMKSLEQCACKSAYDEEKKNEDDSSNEYDDLVAYAKHNVLLVDKASHESLFPLCSAIVHHGGAGTTNASLRSGSPTIITPIFFDQFDHAHLVSQLEVGIGFTMQYQEISACDLADAITSVISSNKIKERAQSVAEQLKLEDGVGNAVKEVEEFWEKHVVTGEHRSFLHN